MMTIVLLVICVGLLSCLSGYAQQTDTTTTFKARNAVYAELGGSALIYTLTYDRLLSDRKIWKWGANAGIAFFPTSANSAVRVSYGTIVGGLYGLRRLKATRRPTNRYVELGLSSTIQLFSNNSLYALENKSNTFVWLVPRVGLRWQKPTGGIMARVAFTPLIPLTRNGDYPRFIYFWAGASVGYSF